MTGGRELRKERGHHGIVRFKCVGATNRYLNLYSAGTASDGMNVVLYTSDASDEQKWNYDGLRLLSMTNPSFALDKYTVAGNANNRNADIWTANDPVNQNITFVPVTGNTVRIRLTSRSTDTNQFVFLTAFSNANGTGTGKTPSSPGNVYWGDDNSSNLLQQWTFEEVDGGGTPGGGILNLAQLKAKFPHGKYWNHVGQTANNPDGYTSTACPSHATTATCNAYDGPSWQCLGLAEKCGYDTTGFSPRVNANGWSKIESAAAVDSVKAGDIVRYQNGNVKHAIFVTGVSGGTVTFGDCNGTGRNCEIRWGATISKQTLKNNFIFLEKAPKTLS